jgi:hypothetical protein
MARKRIAEQTKGMGKPKVGGPFNLVDQDGNKFTNEDMLGKYALVRLSPFVVVVRVYGITCMARTGLHSARGI